MNKTFDFKDVIEKLNDIEATCLVKRIDMRRIYLARFNDPNFSTKSTYAEIIINQIHIAKQCREAIRVLTELHNFDFGKTSKHLERIVCSNMLMLEQIEIWNNAYLEKNTNPIDEVEKRGWNRLLSKKDNYSNTAEAFSRIGRILNPKFNCKK